MVVLSLLKLLSYNGYMQDEKRKDLATFYDLHVYNCKTVELHIEDKGFGMTTVIGEILFYLLDH